jgi:hypothetical protein
MWKVTLRRYSHFDERPCFRTALMHVYEILPRKDRRGVDLISDALPFGRLRYDGPEAISDAIGYAMHSSRSHDAVTRTSNA